jgi:hypothetical protein
MMHGQQNIKLKVVVKNLLKYNYYYWVLDQKEEFTIFVFLSVVCSGCGPPNR